MNTQELTNPPTIKPTSKKTGEEPRKIYVVGGDSGYASWMEGLVVDHMAEANLVVFTGGSDVSPMLYHDHHHPTTSCNPARDEEEAIEFDLARLMDKPMVGICRGAQFLCVMAGGKLVQHQQNLHPHKMFTNDPGNPFSKNLEMTVGGDHHQAQSPWGLPVEDWDLLGFSRNASKFHLNGSGNEMIIGDSKLAGIEIEVEIVYYRKINALAIQSHPEWVSKLSDEVAYCRKLLNRLVKGAL